MEQTRALVGRDVRAWFYEHAIVVVFTLFVGVVGWTINATLEALGEDIRTNTRKIEETNVLLNRVLVDQSAVGKRLDFVEDVVQAHAQKFSEYDANIMQFYRDYGKR